MQLSTLLLSGLAATVSAGNFYVDNKCGFPLYLVSRHGNAQSSLITLPANKVNAFNTPIPGADVAQNSITVSAKPDLSSPLQAVYNTGSNPSLTYYDLSTVYGDPLRTQGFELLSGGGGYSVSCKPRTLNGGDCPNTYSPSNPSGKNAVFTQNPSGNLVLQLCSSDGKPN